MLRTFWPAMSLADLPRSDIVRSRLSDWISHWFGESARLYSARIVTAPDVNEAITLAAGENVVAAVSLDGDFLHKLALRSPLLADKDVLRPYATDMVSDLCRQVFISTLTIDAACGNSDAHSVPPDMLELLVQVDGDETSSVTILVSADVFFETPQTESGLAPGPDKHRVVSGVPVSLSIERSIPVSASDLVGLAVDDFVPIAKVGDVGFKLMISGASLGTGYVGHVENNLAIVIES